MAIIESRKHANIIAAEEKAKDDLWREAMIAKNHTPMFDEDGELHIGDGYDNHAGPGCTRCYWSACWYCKTIEDIPLCQVPPMPEFPA